MEKENIQLKAIPVVPMRGLVIFPGTILHFDVMRSKSIMALTEAMNSDRELFMTAQKDISQDDPDSNALYSVGVVANILQIAQIGENIFRVIVKGIYRAKSEEFIDSEEVIEAMTRELKETSVPGTVKTEALMNIAKNMFEEFSVLNPHVPQNMIAAVSEMTDPGKLADYIADNVVRDYKKKQKILEMTHAGKRLEKIITMFKHENSVLAIEGEIVEKTKLNMEENQKEYYLRERLKAIHDELGDEEDSQTEFNEYRDKINHLATNDENKEKLLKEVQRLENSFANSAEANVIRTYLDTCIDLPWGVYTKDKLDIVKIAEKLDKNHYGLKKVKEKIIETLAVRKLNPKANGQILCLAGPPGVGKTSIVRSIADAMGRKYQRIALGGVRDESEIRGHRRTYVGAMMGRIMYAVNQAKSSNPIILLDEIDKLGNDFRGDPSSALLEVLDAEQNSTFYDHYIDMPYDLSKVMFITTANDYTSIPPALADRMELIHIDSYTREEKFRIAKFHLMSKQLKRHGLNARQFKISDDAIYDLADSYTREAGVRSLERELSSLMNKVSVKIVSGEAKSVKITKENIESFLGARKFKNDTMHQNDEVGLVTGLAWTAVGGETLPVEAAVMTGSGKMELTGSLGDVMKESAYAAYTCVSTMADQLNIDSDFYKNKDIHIHVPEGAVPKDGPSAGVTLATAITSALTGKPVRHDVAMTGEITIRGRVLPIGGLKEKTMAAYRLGIKTVIVPEDNRSDLEEVDEIVKNSVEFVFADHINTVLNTALVSD